MEGLAAERSTGGPQDCRPGPRASQVSSLPVPLPGGLGPSSKELSCAQKIPPGETPGRQAGHCPLCPCRGSGQGRLGSRRCHWVTTGSSSLFLHQEEGGNYSCPVSCGVSESELPVKDHPTRPWAGQPGRDCSGTGFLHSTPSFLSPWASAPLPPAPCHSHLLRLRSGEHKATSSGHGEVIGHGRGRQNPPLWT